MDPKSNQGEDIARTSRSGHRQRHWKRSNKNRHAAVEAGPQPIMHVRRAVKGVATAGTGASPTISSQTTQNGVIRGAERDRRLIREGQVDAEGDCVEASGHGVDD